MLDCERVRFCAADNNKRAVRICRGVHYNRVFDISARAFWCAHNTNDSRGLVSRMARPRTRSEHII